MAGAEIIDLDANSQIAQRRKVARHNRRLIVEKIRFQQFEGQSGMVDLQPRQFHAKLRVAQPGFRQIDRQPGHWQALGGPPVEIRHRLAQDDLINRRHDIQILGRCQKLGGLQDAVGRGFPADQRLDPSNRPGPCIELRLVDAKEFVAFDAAKNLVRPLLVRQSRRTHLVGKETVAAAPLGLGAVQRQIGVHEQRLAVDLPALGHRDADADAIAAGVALIVNRLRDPGNQSLGQPAKLGIAWGLRHKDCEFVAAHPCDQRPRHSTVPQDIGGVAQHKVAGIMAKDVIDLFETVQINVQDGRAFRAAVRPFGTLPLHLIQLAAVGQTGQRIMQRIVLHLGPRGLQFAVADGGKLVGGAQRFGMLVLFGGIPVDANQYRSADQILLIADPAADVAHRAIAANDAKGQIIVDTSGQRLLRGPDGKVAVVGVQRPFPNVARQGRQVGGKAIDRPQPGIPLDMVARDIILPDPDLHRGQRQFQPA